MERLKQAKALFTQPLTLDELRLLDQLEREAEGKERDCISELWTTVYTTVHPVVLHQARVEGLL